MSRDTVERFDAWIPVALVIAGSLVFLAGGSRHPHLTGDAMGVPGSDEYFRHFADMIRARPNWEGFHTLILVGPVMWALGAWAALPRLAQSTIAASRVGAAALLAGSVLWAIGFVLDGYAGPRMAHAIYDAGIGNDAVAIATFGNNAFVMARIGTISFSLLGTGALALGLALLVDAMGGTWRRIVGALGVVAGAWPLAGAAMGHFDPGPFVVAYWTPMAVTLGIWFLLLAMAVSPRAPSAGANAR